MSTGKPIVFVSYAHRDQPEKPGPEGFAWLSFVLEYLNVGRRAGAFDLWVDTQMMGGANWRADIKAKLGVCDIFVLLVSARSMASDFILNEELPVLRERDAKGEAVHIYPVLLTPTPILGLDKVRDKNIRPRDAQPLSKFSIEHDRPQKMSEIADEIATLARRIAALRDTSNIEKPVRIPDAPPPKPSAADPVTRAMNEAVDAVGTDVDEFRAEAARRVLKNVEW
jgi:hypothetical protein